LLNFPDGPGHDRDLGALADREHTSGTLGGAGSLAGRLVIEQQELGPVQRLGSRAGRCRTWREASRRGFFIYFLDGVMRWRDNALPDG